MMVAKKNKIKDNEILMISVFVFILSIFSTLGILGTFDITGLAVGDTATGRVNATVDAVIDISLPDASSITFGSMEPNELNATGNITAGVNAPEGVEVQNDGNVAVDINITSTKTATTMFNGTATTANFEWNCTLDVNGSNPGLYGRCNLSNWAAVATTKTAGNSDPGVIFVTGLNYTDTTDNATLNLKVKIPPDEPVWTTGATITFGAWQA